MAALVLFVAPVLASPRPAAAGVLPPPIVPDASFGNGGVADVGASPGLETSSGIAPYRMPDGRYYVLNAEGLHRRLADGTPDMSYGSAGTALTGNLGVEFSQLGIDNDSVVVSAAGSPGTSAQLERIDASGRQDLSFGTSGAASAPSDCGLAPIVVQPSRRILVACRSYIYALSATGVIDRSFGSNGSLVLTDFTWAPQLLLDGTRFVAAGNALDGSLVVARFTADGAPDTTFGSNGRFVGTTAEYASAITRVADGGYAIAASGPATTHVVKLTSAGTPDNSFGSVGRTSIDRPGATADALLALADGGVLVGGADVPAEGGREAFVGRLDSIGQPAAGYGTGGFFTLSGDGAESVTTLVTDGTPAGALASLDTSLGGRLARIDASGHRVGADPLLRDLVVIGGVRNATPTPVASLVDQLDRLVVVGKWGGSGIILRFLRDGRLDPSFGSSGRVLARATALGIEEWSAVVLDSSGAIVVSGSAFASGAIGSRSVPIAGRVLPDGSLDTAVGPAGASAVRELAGLRVLSDRQTVGVAALPNGQMLVGGTRQTSSTDPKIRGFVARLLPTGALDSSFASSGVASLDAANGVIAVAMAPRQNGFVFIGDAWRSNAGSLTHRPAFAALAADGTPGAVVVTPGTDSDEVKAASVTADGGSVLIVHPQSPTSGSEHLQKFSSTFVRINSFKVVDPGLAPGFGLNVTSQPDGGALVTPTFMRFRRDGSIDPVWLGTIALPRSSSGAIFSTTSVSKTLSGAPVIAFIDVKPDLAMTLRVVRYRFTPDVQDVTSKFIPVTPSRILDTRVGLGRAGTSRPAPFETVTVSVAGRGGLPATGISAVVLNVAVTDATGRGYVTVWPTGDPRPYTANLNVEYAGETVSNQVIVAVRAAGSVSIVTQSGAHLVVDVQGYFLPANTSTYGRYEHRGPPQRLLDTRLNGAARPGAGAVVEVQLPYADVEAAVLNVTATDAAGRGFVTVWPSGQPPPSTANLNVEYTGETVANQVIVSPGTGSRVSIFTQSGTHLVVDYMGDFTNASASANSGGLYVAATPTRVLDTRTGAKPGPNSTTNLRLYPGQALMIAAVLNVTMTEASAPGYVTVFGGGEARPPTANLNAAYSGETVPNLVTTRVSWANGVDIYSQSGGHLVVDFQGAFVF